MEAARRFNIDLNNSYMIGDRLLRAAMVVVSMGPEKKEEKK